MIPDLNSPLPPSPRRLRQQAAGQRGIRGGADGYAAKDFGVLDAPENEKVVAALERPSRRLDRASGSDLPLQQAFPAAQVFPSEERWRLQTA